MCVKKEVCEGDLLFVTHDVATDISNSADNLNRLYTSHFLCLSTSNHYSKVLREECQYSPFLMSMPSWFSECVGVGGPPPILLLFADIVSGSNCDFTTNPSPS